jgi:glycosyltransferase involved in cell wall biosynthesis
MHILLFFTYEISLRSWISSGLFEREIKLYKYLNNLFGCRFTFITYDKEPINLKEYDFIKIIPIYDLINYSNNKYLRFLKSLVIPFKLNKLVKNVDIIKTNQLNGSWIAIILKFLIKKPLLIRTGYDLYTFSIKEEKSFFTRIFYFLLTKFSIKFANIYTVSSNTDRSFINKKYKIKKEIVVLPNWIEKKENNIKFKKYKNRILSVGRLEKQKNYKFIIEELKDSEIIIDIVGAGGEEVFLKELATANNVKVNFLGILPHNELLKLYNNYKIFISASKYEGNPKAILEAMSSGCIVLAMKNENIEEIINHNKNGIIFEENKTSLEEIIDNLLKNDELLNRISYNASKEVLEKNSIESIVNLEFEIYNKLRDV